MATDYDLIPTLIERIAASQLVVIVAGARLIDVQRDRVEAPPRILGVFEVDVEDVLDGERPADRLLVRVLGEGHDERARWLVPLTDSHRLVLLLTRDVGPDLPEGLYAPVFASGFRIDNDSIELPEEAVDERTRELAEVRDGRATLGGLRRLLEVVRRERAEAHQQLEQFLPPEALSRPYPDTEEIPPEIVEIPPALSGTTISAARPSDLGRAPEADTPLNR
jgi:hypothetical protein